MNKIVADDRQIINTTGIRYIQKQDGNTYGMGKFEWVLIVNLKNNHMSYSYPTKEQRDAMFEKLKKVMVPDESK